MRPVTPFYFLLLILTSLKSIDTREILLSRNEKRTQTYNNLHEQQLNSSHRGINFAMGAKCDDKRVRSVENQTSKRFVVLN